MTTTSRDHTTHRIELGWARNRTGRRSLLSSPTRRFLTAVARLASSHAPHRQASDRRSRVVNAIGLALPCIGIAGLSSIWWALILAGPALLVWDLASG